MRGWQRDMSFEHTGLPWVMPSPNMPTVDTALVYPGMCLVEGTELSEGRGTTRPFELAGAPYLDGHELAAALDRDGAAGRAVPARSCSRRRSTSTRSSACGGVQLHVTNAETFRPYRTGVAFLKACHAQAPAQFAWRAQGLRVRRHRFPRSICSPAAQALREGIEAGASLDDLAARWPRDEGAFAEERARVSCSYRS